jgi:hypothetical protein
MNTYGKCVLTSISLLLAYSAMIWGMGMMNQPSDRSLYAGLAIVLGLLALLPGVLWIIWRRT